MLMGFAPHDAKVGDLVVSFGKGKSAVVRAVQRVGDEEEVLRVVGSCHINIGRLEDLTPVFDVEVAPEGNAVVDVEVDEEVWKYISS